MGLPGAIEALSAGAPATGSRLESAPERIHFCQADPRWAQLPYYGGDMAHCGCGLCAFTMAVGILTGSRMTPADVYRIRAAQGVGQSDDRGGICARDAHECFNCMNERLFGVRSAFLEDSTVEGFRRVLSAGGNVIWCSSRDIGEPWIWSDGAKQACQHPEGHLVCVWKYEDGRFLVKDSWGDARRGNDVAYDEARFARWLEGVRENRYVLRAL